MNSIDIFGIKVHPLVLGAVIAGGAYLYMNKSSEAFDARRYRKRSVAPRAMVVPAAMQQSTAPQAMVVPAASDEGMYWAPTGKKNANPPVYPTRGGHPRRTTGMLL
jgi:hypothetical protein